MKPIYPPKRFLKEVSEKPNKPGGQDPVNPSDFLKSEVKDADRLGYSDFEGKVFDDYDWSTTKVGYPYVGIYGTKHGVCTHCDGPVYEKREEIGGALVVFCPSCRRQLYRSIDESGRFTYNQNLDPGQTPYNAVDTPLPGDLPFDQGNYAGSGARTGTF